MRADSIILVMTGGLVAFAGCDGGGGALEGSPDPLENGSYQEPPSSYEKPPSTTNTVTDYQSPTGTDVCDAICSFYELSRCVTEGSANPDANGEGGRGDGGGQVLARSECMASCAKAIVSYPCRQELVGVIDCLFDRADLTCELLQQAQSGQIGAMDAAKLEACQSAVSVYTACADAREEPPVTHCSAPNDCGECSNACTRCLCQRPDETAMCTQSCAN
jgi:hypothetical protein